MHNDPSTPDRANEYGENYDFIVVADVNGIIVHWSGTAEFTFGQTAQQALGTPLIDLLKSSVNLWSQLPWLNPPTKETLYSYLVHQTHNFVELGTLVHVKDGIDHVTTLNAAVVKDAQGNVCCMTISGKHSYATDSQEIPPTTPKGYIKDRLDVALWMLSLVESSNDGVLVTDPRLPDNPIVYASSTFQHQTGYELNEVLGENCRFLKGKDTDAKTRAQLRKALAEGRRWEGDLLNYRKDGTTFWNHLTVLPVFDEEDELVNYLGIIRDITEERHTTQFLKESEQRISELANAAPIMLWSADAEMQCTCVNQAWLDFTGNTFEYSLGNGWLSGVLPSLAQDLDDQLEQFCKSRERFDIEVKLKHCNGDYRWVTLFGSPRFVGKQFVGYVGGAWDIHQRREAEQTNQTLLTELAHSQRKSSLGEMASVLAHELNQPLGAIANYASEAAERLSNGVLPNEDAATILQQIADQAVRAGGITNRLKNYATNSVPATRATPLSSILGSALDLIKHDAQARNTTILSDLGELSLVQADSVQIQQVLVNLLLNAMDAMQEVPALTREIEVVATPDAARQLATIRVTNNGRTLRADHAEQLFKPYYTTKPGGVGLGLSVSRTIVQNHGGTIWANTTEDDRTMFTFTLPLAKELG